MGDRKDKHLLGKDDVEVTFPEGGGLRRSRRVQKLDPVPPPTPGEGEGSSAAGGRKRKRGRPLEAEDATEEGVTHEGAKVMKSVKVVSAPAKASLVAGAGVTVDGGEVEEAGKRSQRRQQPSLIEGGSEKVGGSVVKLGEAASSSSVIIGAAAGRKSEDRSAEQSVGEEQAHPCLFIGTILDVIFKHVMEPPGSNSSWVAISQDVQSIRLVCKAWKDSSTRLYRRIRPTPASFAEPDQLNKFLEVMESSDMIPVSKFHFSSAGVFGQEDLKGFGDFLRICRPKLATMKMEMERCEALRFMSNLRNIPGVTVAKIDGLESELEIE